MSAAIPTPNGQGPNPLGPTVFGPVPGSQTGATSGNGLSGDQNNAYQVMVGMLNQWGLGALAPDVLKFIQQGYDQTAVSFLLQDTDAYKQRFAGNEVRRKNGLPVLSPQDYLSTEAAYRQIMHSSGLPSGFYDQPSDFSNWIGNDVSASEVNSRVNMAVDAANKLSDGTKQAFQQYYGIQPNDLAAYFLDQSRAMPLLQTQARATAIGGAAINAGSGLGQSRAEQLAAQSNLSDTELAKNESSAVVMGQQGALLSDINGGHYGQSDAENELFLNDAQAAERRRRLAAQETSNFTGGQLQSGRTQLGQPAASY